MTFTLFRLHRFALNPYQCDHDCAAHHGVVHPHVHCNLPGGPTFHWQLQHIPLNASRTFQVEFEVRKGSGVSSGGISVDDINLFEISCPHHVWHISSFDHFLTNGSAGKTLLSPRFVTRQSYGLQLLLRIYAEHIGVFFRLVSTDHDDQLQWPCAWRQVTVSLLDQSNHVQQRMSKQFSIMTDSEKTFRGGERAALI